MGPGWPGGTTGSIQQAIGFLGSHWGIAWEHGGLAWPALGWVDVGMSFLYNVFEIPAHNIVDDQIAHMACDLFGIIISLSLMIHYTIFLLPPLLHCRSSAALPSVMAYLKDRDTSTSFPFTPIVLDPESLPSRRTNMILPTPTRSQSRATRLTCPAYPL